MTKRVLVLGGGSGGLVVANKLSRLSEAEVVLVDADGRHLFYPSFLWVMTGQRQPAQVQRDLAAIEKKGIRFVRGRVAEIRTEDRQVLVDGEGARAEAMEYDHLVVALGADVVPETVSGLAGVGLNLYDLDGVREAATALEGFRGGRIVIAICAVPFKCPAAPYEAAFLIDALLEKRGVRKDADIRIVTPEPQPMPTAGPAIGEALEGMLASRGIKYTRGVTVEAVDPRRGELSVSGGDPIAFDLLIAVPPHTPPEVVAASSLAGPSGWIGVDAGTLSTAYEDVYAIGDVTSIPLPGKYVADKQLNLPKAGVFAHAHAEVVADNIAREITGNGASRRFDGHGWCMIETGHGKAGMGSGNFYATPAPAVKMKSPGFRWHWGKVLFEKYWMRRWF